MASTPAARLMKETKVDFCHPVPKFRPVCLTFTHCETRTFCPVEKPLSNSNGTGGQPDPAVPGPDIQARINSGERISSANFRLLESVVFRLKVVFHPSKIDRNEQSERSLSAILISVADMLTPSSFSIFYEVSSLNRSISWVTLLTAGS